MAADRPISGVGGPLSMPCKFGRPPAIVAEGGETSENFGSRGAECPRTEGAGLGESPGGGGVCQVKAGGGGRGRTGQVNGWRC